MNIANSDPLHHIHEPSDEQLFLLTSRNEFELMLFFLCGSMKS
jgi:hypothetical protein